MEVMFKLGFFFLLLGAAVCRESSDIIDNGLSFNPNRKSYLEGEELNMSCWDDTHSGDCTWLQDDQIIDFEINQRIKINENDSCVITISSLTSDDNSYWTCQFSDGASATKHLTVESNKIVQLIPDKPEVIHVEEGTTAELRCLFNQSASYCYWMKDDNVLVIRGRYRFAGNKNEGNCTIRISRVNHKDYGKWRCCYPTTDNEPALKSFDITLNITVVPTLPFITLNNLQIENEKTIFLITETEMKTVYRNYANYQERVFKTPTGNTIACWTLNGYPEAKLEWTMKDELGYELDYVNRAYKSQTWNVISTSSKLKSSYLEFKFDKDKIYEIGIRRVKLICSANHPSFKNVQKTASVWLIWNHHFDF